jgi:hypothetical protein
MQGGLSAVIGFIRHAAGLENAPQVDSNACRMIVRFDSIVEGVLPA